MISCSANLIRIIFQHVVEHGTQMHKAANLFDQDAWVLNQVRVFRNVPGVACTVDTESVCATEVLCVGVSFTRGVEHDLHTVAASLGLGIA